MDNDKAEIRPLQCPVCGIVTPHKLVKKTEYLPRVSSWRSTHEWECTKCKHPHTDEEVC